MISVFIGTVLFLAGGCAALVLKEKYQSIVFIGCAALAQCFILPALFGILFSGGRIEASIAFSDPIGISWFRLDPLAALFALIISLGVLLAAVYSRGYMKLYAGDSAGLSSYYFFLGLMAMSMILVVIVQNALLFLLVWELMSLASFFLVNYEHSKEDIRKAGIYYLIAMQVGAAFLIAAFGWSYAISGSLDFDAFKIISTGPMKDSILIVILFFLGFGTKAGFVPLHTWLPKAHPAAPTAVSALMSGVMIKTGLYGILRMYLIIGIPDDRLVYGFLLLSIITGLYGVANAIAQRDLKKILAFSSIENIGIIGMGMGVGMLGINFHHPLVAALGFFSALLHAANHFAFKSVLFYGTGILYAQTHTRDLEKLGGLHAYLPFTSIMFFIASLAISGMPLFNGFVSEFSLFLGIVKSFSFDNLPVATVALLSLSGLALIGAMALICFTKVYGMCFLGTPRTVYHTPPSEKSAALLFPMMFMTGIIVLLGIFPILTIAFLYQVVGQFVPELFGTALTDILSSLTSISMVLAVFLFFIVFFYIVRSLFLRNKPVQIFKTWDCGYQEASSRVQYTGSSFAQPFLQLTAELVPQKVQVHKEQELFPVHASFESHAQDFSERVLIQPSIRALNKFLNKFSWIQSGKMQQYIIYGLIFLVTLLIWVWSGK
jgi:hydrogenase-4 component B